MKKPQIHITLDFKTAQRLEDEAKKRGVSVSSLARMYIERGLREQVT